MSLSPILRDFLIRFQQTAIRETGRRPVTWLRGAMDADLMLPGCPRAGSSFWQPVAWPDGTPPLGAHADAFHASIIEYVSMCQFLEIHFLLPVARAESPLSFLYGRVFETCKSTVSAPPSRAFEEALYLHEKNPRQPLAYLMATTCDAGEGLMLLIRASDGQVFVQRGADDPNPLYLKATLERLLPKLHFVYDLRGGA